MPYLSLSLESVRSFLSTLFITVKTTRRSLWQFCQHYLSLLLFSVLLFSSPVFSFVLCLLIPILSPNSYPVSYYSPQSDASFLILPPLVYPILFLHPCVLLFSVLFLFSLTHFVSFPVLSIRSSIFSLFCSITSFLSLFSFPVIFCYFLLFLVLFPLSSFLSFLFFSYISLPCPVRYYLAFCLFPILFTLSCLFGNVSSFLDLQC